MTNVAGSEWERRGGSSSDSRPDARRDHDRVFYSAEFERLEDVTQIATLTSSSVRNRLTHSYRVEQIAQSIAQTNCNVELIDEEVVKTAALVHDMGHAPFGHTGEEALQRAVTCVLHRDVYPTRYTARIEDVPNILKDGVRRKNACEGPRPCLLPDGFEGNAQTFRILTLLASNHPSSKDYGLNLTRRTLLASLKYPWLHGENEKKPSKWGVYDADADAFAWVLGLNSDDGDTESALQGPRDRSLEASIMDIADDIAYAVHDLEDAHKAGLIPFAEISMAPVTNTFLRIISYIRAEVRETNSPLGGSPVMRIVDEWDRFTEAGIQELPSRGDLASLGYPYLNQVAQVLSMIDPSRYSGGVSSRAALSQWRGGLISLFVNDVDISTGQAKFRSDRLESAIEFLKQLTWYFVIDDPDLSAIREGQEALISACFDRLFDQASSAWLETPGAESSDWASTPSHRATKRLPERLVDYLALGRVQESLASVRRCTPQQIVARAVVDYICSLTDSEVYSYSLQVDGAPSHSAPRAFAS
ncbi:dGTP triphosphohydrolase [Microbacterium sp. NPDC089180]|uniref:deoxyguanosinetriphosphate triphosphohydrolase family protein n=1 Tax=unclassified Microbacterium TaxID=2609290 RepID=UPI00343D8FB7